MGYVARALMKLDTGAQVNLIPESDFAKLSSKPRVYKTTQGLRAYGDSQIPVIGKCILTVKHKNKTKKLQFLVLSGNNPQSSALLN